MPGSKVRKHVVLAHKWLYDFTTRPDMRITVDIREFYKKTS